MQETAYCMDDLFKEYNEIYHEKICINENMNKIRNSIFNLDSYLSLLSYQIF